MECDFSLYNKSWGVWVFMTLNLRRFSILAIFQIIGFNNLLWVIWARLALKSMVLENVQSAIFDYFSTHWTVKFFGEDQVLAWDSSGEQLSRESHCVYWHDSSDFSVTPFGSSLRKDSFSLICHNMINNIVLYCRLISPIITLILIWRTCLE